MASPEFAVLDLELDAYRRRVRAYAKARNDRRESGDTADGPSSVVLASNLLYLTPDQRAELTRRIFDLLRDYELEDPDHVPEGAERMATMWSMIPDDRGPAAAKPAAAKPPPASSRRPARTAAKATGRPEPVAAARREPHPGRPQGPAGTWPYCGRKSASARAVISGRMRGILQNMVN